MPISTFGLPRVITWRAHVDSADFTGTSGDDAQDGTNHADVFNYKQGGEDHLNGFGGNDTFIFGGAFDASDQINGGDGYDILKLDGDYSSQVIFGAATLTGVEEIDLAAGHNYSLAFADNVGAGIVVDAHALKAANILQLTTGTSSNSANVTGGRGNDQITTAGGNDTIKGGNGNDNLAPSLGTDAVYGGMGDDNIIFSAGAFDAADTIGGGKGLDTVSLTIASDVNVTLLATTLTNIEVLQAFGSGIGDHNLTLTEDDANVAAGATLGVAVVGNVRLVFDGSHETDGSLHLVGGTLDDVLVGGEQNDTFQLDGGDDAALGEDGDDLIFGSSTVDINDTLVGGAGFDTLDLDGDYNLTWVQGSLSGIENIVLATGHNYTLATSDANVAAGVFLTVDGSANSGTLVFNGAAETDGGFVLQGGAGNDTLTAGQQSDFIHIEAGGSDTVHGGAGGDVILGGGAIGAGDVLDGGADPDVLDLDGDYSLLLLFQPGMLDSIETLRLETGYNYNIATALQSVPIDVTLTVDGSGIDATHSLTFDASPDPGGIFVITGGAGGDTITGSSQGTIIDGGQGNDALHGGAGNDTLTGGDGNDFITGFDGGDTITPGDGTDTINYGDVHQSTGTGYDTVIGFDTDDDTFSVASSHPIGDVDPEVFGGTLSKSSFNGDLAAAIDGAALAKNHAVLFAPDDGTLAGKLFLIVDCNGHAGYQANQDMVVRLTDAQHLNHLSSDNFTQS